MPRPDVPSAVRDRRKPPAGALPDVTIERTIVMHGANWASGASVALAIVGGTLDARRWKKAVALAARVRPPTFPPPEDHPVPPTTAAAIERLARDICAWCGLASAPAARTPFGRTATRAAALPLQCEAVTPEAFAFAVDLVRQAGNAETDQDWVDAAAERLEALRKKARKWLPKSRRWIARAAEARGIPWHPVVDTAGVLLLGEGRWGRRFDSTLTQYASKMAFDVASNKRSGNLRLRRAGIPVARQMLVEDLAGAVKAAAALGLPLVLKPVDTQRQTGIGFVFQPEEVEAAFAFSSAHGKVLVAESFIPGREYRVLICHDEVIAAYERPSPQVVGDGISTIAELVQRENANDAVRGERASETNLAKLKLDEQSHAYLRHLGWTTESVPKAGEVVQTHPLPFLGVGGGLRVDATDRIHPDNVVLCRRALAAIGLDVGGIDFRTPDISRSWREVGAGLCEVNAQPDLSAHYLPGLEGDFAGRFIDKLYPASARGRMRHILLLGRGDLAEHAVAVRDMLQAEGLRIGIAIPGQPIELDGFASGARARSLRDVHGVMIEDPTLDAAVYVSTESHVAQAGLGMGHADIALLAKDGDGEPNAFARYALQAAGARITPLPPSPRETAELVRISLQSGAS